MTKTSIEIGHYLAHLRDQAGLKQAELARKITWSASVLSKIESGDREVTQEELEMILTAIGSDDTLLFAERLKRNWQELKAPPLDHPDQDILWKAEDACQQLVALKAKDNVTAAFQHRLDEYLQELKQVSGLILRRDHTVAFIGSIGIGKSTAICRMTGLEVIQEDSAILPVLEAGAGGITICEVHVYNGPQYGIQIEPCSDEEIRNHVIDFANHISPIKGSENESLGISKEIERAIRNMTGLTRKKEKVDGKLIRHDQAKEIAAKFPSPRELVVEILSRMQLPRRDARQVWYDSATGKSPMLWLKDTFELINNGRHADFTLPKRIEVVIPRATLSNTSLTTRIIDTKGIDRSATRADLEGHLNDPHTLSILCSSFNDAPSANARVLLERAKEAGIRDLTLKAALVCLPRAEEALAVKDDTGERVESTEEGYELKSDQIKTSLEPLEVQELPIAFFNAREDTPEDLQNFVIEQLNRVRERFNKRLSLATSNAIEVIENQEQEQVQAVQRAAAKHLKHWILENNECPTIKNSIQSSLLSELQEAHSSTINASIRRNGQWDNLDYSHQLGHGAKALATAALARKVQEFKSIAKNLRTNEEFLAAVTLITQSERVLQFSYSELLGKMELFGKDLYANDLRKDTEYWRNCEDEWGQGSGYRERITERTQAQFNSEKYEEWTELLKNQLSENWKESLRRVADLLDV